MATLITRPYNPEGKEVGDPRPQSNGYAGSDSNDSKSPLDRFGFFKNLSISDKKTTRDGQPPKRRGPKPDSKPALTRRQELNRQAQRTHRERKEMYIKALEQEVLRLKETFGSTARERDAIAEENRKLKEILAAHGINYEDILNRSHGHSMISSSFTAGSSAGSTSGGYGPGSISTGMTSPSLMPERMPPPPPNAMMHGMPMQQQQPAQNQGLDYDQIGIDFVLTLERQCMDHMQFLMVRSQDSTGEISGHALMATCPPHSHINEQPEEKYPHKMPDVGKADLVKLLDLSTKLPIDQGEITPIMAWAGIRAHPQFFELGAADFVALKEVLDKKVRCYGFGAVLEEFEVQDALENVLATKMESYAC